MKLSPITAVHKFHDFGLNSMLINYHKHHIHSTSQQVSPLTFNSSECVPCYQLLNGLQKPLPTGKVKTPPGQESQGCMSSTVHYHSRTTGLN